MRADQKTSLKSIWQSRLFRIFLIYLFLTIVYLPQIFFGSLQPENTSTLINSIVHYAIGNVLWFFVTLIVFGLSRRYQIREPLELKILAVHLIFAILLSLLFTLTYFFILGVIDGVGFGHLERILGSGFLLSRYVINSFIFYAGIVALVSAINFNSLYRDREFRLQQAELENLKMQLHPHFLFNTLNAVSTLVYVSPQKATKTITQLSDLLRQTLSSNKTQEITLKEELDFLRKYLQIQQTLLQDRLQVNWKIVPETLDALVPNMILQPLVENSIRHGIAPLRDGGTIEIASCHKEGNLLLSVKDNGRGINSKKNGNEGGVGLHNTQARLRQLYPGSYVFELKDSPLQSGVTVNIAIPFREGVVNPESSEIFL